MNKPLINYFRLGILDAQMLHLAQETSICTFGIVTELRMAFGIVFGQDVSAGGIGLIE